MSLRRPRFNDAARKGRRQSGKALAGKPAEAQKPANFPVPISEELAASLGSDPNAVVLRGTKREAPDSEVKEPSAKRHKKLSRKKAKELKKILERK